MDKLIDLLGFSETSLIVYIGAFCLATVAFANFVDAIMNS